MEVLTSIHMGWYTHSIGKHFVLIVWQGVVANILYMYKKGMADSIFNFMAASCRLLLARLLSQYMCISLVCRSQ